ncbi:MAG TPA: L,D-transpeptidase, partial [Anaerolineales bacterium]|nr:L,D-transpeptidase [Anaerolineales bacterium]
MTETKLTRRAFLRLAALGMGGLAFRSLDRSLYLPEFPAHDRLGRVVAGKVEVKARPDIDSETVGVLFDDAVLPWLSETVGPRPLWYSQRWVETPDGYIYAPNLQPVRNLPNSPITALPESGGKPGMWVEVTVPYANLILMNPPARSPWLKEATLPRVYYSQILWVDEIKTDAQSQIWYRVNERYGTYGDIFWVAGEALRPLAAEEMSPISPNVEAKKVVIDVTYQTMACYEGSSEVFFTRISSGAKFDAQGNPVDKWSTPVGPHHIWRKLVSVHMSGGTTGGGYDLPGIGWTTLFSGDGVAIHSTFWHNNFGVPMSHGCVNARPEDA